MALTIQNVDLIRNEHRGTNILERNTREWATSRKDTAGNSLRCDADNGGDSTGATSSTSGTHGTSPQLFSEHKECISTFNQREADFTNLIQEASPPHAIYVPTVAVHNNLASFNKEAPPQSGKMLPHPFVAQLGHHPRIQTSHSTNQPTPKTTTPPKRYLPTVAITASSFCTG
ncbi:hypothetical protein MHU86_10892 [Fragilaria crotonensis]|nr:hypothetical protein MHU86_10892 [Fragilaria crotonensis]